MVVLVISMLVCLLLGAVVVGYVAMQARRDGRDVLTPQSEEFLAGVRRRGDDLRGQAEQVRGSKLAPAGRE